MRTEHLQSMFERTRLLVFRHGIVKCVRHTTRTFVVYILFLDQLQKPPEQLPVTRNEITSRGRKTVLLVYTFCNRNAAEVYLQKPHVFLERCVCFVLITAGGHDRRVSERLKTQNSRLTSSGSTTSKSTRRLFFRNRDLFHNSCFEYTVPRGCRTTLSL